MAVRTPCPPTGQSSRLSRFASLGFKPAKAPQRSPRRESEEDWYIPYNGPYELPDETESDANRDSWGQVVDATGREVHRRPDGHGDDGPSRIHNRVTSNVSIVTKSSCAIDPSRASFHSIRQFVPVSTADAPPLPSYVDLDLTSGVGGSPSPRQQSFSASPKRTSRSPFRSFFGKQPQPVSTQNGNSLGYAAQALSSFEHGKTSTFASQTGPNTCPPPDVHETHHYPTSGHLKQPASVRNDPGDMFLTQPPLVVQVQNDAFDQYPHSSHPYAYASSRTHLAVPDNNPFSAPPGQSFSNGSAVPIMSPALHTSASTPNLRKNKPSPFSRARDRWFSAESWCDAILFPKPRFKIKQEGQTSGRIVSPPDSPLLPSEKLGHGAQSHPSRILAHSRSMAELRSPKASEGLANTSTRQDMVRPPDIHIDAHHANLPTHDKTMGPAPAHHGSNEPTSRAAADNTNEHLARPRSFALDDLALPSPIPSLSTVLEQGRQLDQQRQAWQSQATHSFQNNRGRSLSRKRTKSAGANGKKPDTAIDFLAARAWLGRQVAAPAVVVSSPKENGGSRRSHSQKNSLSKPHSQKTHSQKNSLSKTLSSSKSHAQKGHSRDSSWSKGALKKAKDSVAGCVHMDATLTPQDERNWGDLRPENSIAYANFIPQVQRVSPIGSLTPSPAPSSIPASQVGLAISTPPPRSYDEDSVQMSSHPYAQGGAYSWGGGHHTPKGSEDLGYTRGSSVYAGPHPIQYEATSAGDVGGRRAVALQHLYASHWEDESQGTPRFDGEAPSSSRFIQGDPGYSESLSSYGTFLSKDPSSSRQRKKLDRVSIGEALAYSMLRPGDRDSGLGTSEGHDTETSRERSAALSSHGQSMHPEAVATSSGDAMSHSHGQPSLRRKPVQYDIHRPLHSISHTTSTAPSHVTIGSIGSSFLENATHDMPRPPNDRQNSSGESASSPPISPPPLGNFDDMDNFRDLFYRPGRTDADTEVSSTMTTMTTSASNRRTASGLTTLTRQLSQELAQLQRASDTSVVGAGESDPPNTLGNLHFVLEPDHTGDDTVTSHAPPLAMAPHGKIHAFQPSVALPEDVVSSRASSPLEGTSEDGHAFRFGSVDAVTTPSVNTSDYRFSQRLSLVPENSTYPTKKELSPIGMHLSPRDSALPVPSPTSANPYSRVSSGGFTRSSQMTSSTSFSRMSGLSDFPSPPENTSTPAHISVINSFFSPANELDERQALSKDGGADQPAAPATRPQIIRRYTFGTSEDDERLPPNP